MKPKMLFRIWDPTERKMFPPFELGFANGYEGYDIFTAVRDNQAASFVTTGPGDEMILMRSTGLKDKNGKEIFEGDIIRTVQNYSDGEKRTYRSTVDQAMQWNCGCCENIYGWALTPDHERGEIVGNIYENPGLRRS